MIIVKLLGGLGNQLFQFAYGYSLSKKTGKSLVFDSSVYKKYHIRNLEIQNFSLNGFCDLEDTEISSCKKAKYLIFQKIFKLSNFFFKKIIPYKPKGKIRLFFVNLFAKSGYVCNLDTYYYDTPSINSNDIFLYGYFQSDRYFSEYRNEICSMLHVRKPSDVFLKYKNLIESVENPVAISIRCGKDYIGGVLDICGKEYFKKAIKIISQKTDNSNFFIFSDDNEYVKKNYNFDCEVEYIENLSPCEGLEIMSLCKNFIISNSSFSWWGAYLSENDDKIIVSPNKWNKCGGTPAALLDYEKLYKIDV